MHDACEKQSGVGFITVRHGGLHQLLTHNSCSPHVTCTTLVGEHSHYSTFEVKKTKSSYCSWSHEENPSKALVAWLCRTLSWAHPSLFLPNCPFQAMQVSHITSTLVSFSSLWARSGNDVCKLIKGADTSLSTVYYDSTHGGRFLQSYAVQDIATVGSRAQVSEAFQSQRGWTRLYLKGKWHMLEILTMCMCASNHQHA